MRGKVLVMTVLLVGNLRCGHAAELFHAGWTGRCEGCHGMVKGDALASGATSSEICLSCHGASLPRDHQVATHPAPPPGMPPQSLTPGGDFAYLRKDYYWTDPGGKPGVSPGERHGHNIIAPAYGYFQDTTYAVAPGGTYPSDQLSCISCHDPHGNFRVVDLSGTIESAGNPIAVSGSYGATPTATEATGTYRLLAGRGYSTRNSSHVFQYDPMIAVAPRRYNRPETGSDTRVAYGRGTTEWCANCHGELAARAASGDHAHRSGIALGEEIAQTYNRYVKSGTFSGSQANAFTSLVPFQSGEVTSAAQLEELTRSSSGPGPADRVTCLTCHRAHASAWDHATRWDTKSEFLTVAATYPGIDAPDRQAVSHAKGKTAAEYRKGMYDREAAQFASYQRSLCNKCHAKD